MIVLLLLLTCAGAFFFGMMGLGSGVLYVPLLSWWGMDLKTGAIPLSLLLGSATGAAAMVTYLKAGLVRTRTGGTAVFTAILGAPLGAYVVHLISTELVKIIFATVAALVVIRIFSCKEPALGKRWKDPAASVAALAMGFLAGFSSGLLGIGGGFVVVPSLLAMGFSTKEAVATSSMVVTFSALSGFLSHLPNAHFSAVLAVVLAGCAIIGSSLGGLLVSKRARPRPLRIILGIVLAGIAVRIFLEGMWDLLRS